MTPKSAVRDSDEEGLLEYEAGSRPFQIVSNKDFPKRGAFVLESLGKNVILVGSQRLRQGEVALLSSGTPIRMSTYSLYFLLPTDTPDPPKTMDISPPGQQQSIQQESPAGASKGKTLAGVKRKMPSAISPSSSQDKGDPPSKKSKKVAPFSQLQHELDNLPIDELLDRMNEAVTQEKWERKHQLIGSTISFHAVQDAMAAPEVRKQAAESDGVARTVIMQWIKESPKYKVWVQQMNSKMEAKSYQNTITKSLLKAGNVRTGTGGRYIKWQIPGLNFKPGSKKDGDPDTAAAPAPSSSAKDEKNMDDGDGEEGDHDNNNDENEDADEQKEEHQNDEDEGEEEEEDEGEDEDENEEADEHDNEGGGGEEGDDVEGQDSGEEGGEGEQQEGENGGEGGNESDSEDDEE